MKKQIFLLLISILASTFLIHAQGKILLLNGKIFEFDSISKTTDNHFVFVSHGTKKPCTIKASRVFSITNSNGKEELFYVMDSVNNMFTLPQMRDYIKGEQDSRKYYHPKFATIGGLVVGGCSGILGIFYGPVLPALYTTIVAASSPPDIAKKTYADINLINSDYYAYGFETASRKKKFTNALLGGGIGFGISVTAFIIFRPKH